MNTKITSDALLKRLLTLHPKLIDLSLGRMERLLAALGHPERALPPVVHVTGTNGKGSVIAFMRAGLEAAGHGVHVYTSPHLTRFHERIRLAGALIAEDALAALLEECEAANAGETITFFEVTTAAAFLAFSRSPADILLLENGLGGRLDATNVVPRPLLSVITEVSLDHEQYLGEGLARIAFEKAGILKPGVPAVIGPQPEEAAGVIAARAAEVGAPLIRHGQDFHATRAAQGLRYEAGGTTLDLPPPALPGDWQLANAATAVACLGALDGFELSGEHIATGLRDVVWPGRMQRLTRGRLASRLPEGWELWLDSGHNPAAGRSLAGFAGGWRDRPLHLVIGMLNTKDATGFLAPFAGVAAHAHCVTIPGEPASLPAVETAAFARAAGLEATAAEDVAAALDAIAANEPNPARVLICGSIYLAGKVLAENG